MNHAPGGEAHWREPPTGYPLLRFSVVAHLAALRNDRVEAPWLLDGPINGEHFTVYVEKVLLPTLKPGDIVILDGAPRHPFRRRQARLPAEILPRSQSDRASAGCETPSTG